MEIEKYIGFLRRCLTENAKVDARITLRVRGGSGTRPVPAQLAGVAIRRTAGAVLRIAFIDLSRQEEEEEKRIRVKQATQINDFALVALSRVDFSEIASAAAMLAAQVLRAGFVEVLELHPERGALRTVATAGRKRNAAAKDVSAGDSPYDRVLRTRRPVLLEEPAEVVSRAAHLAQARVVSGVAVLVPADPARPYGVLGAYSRIRRPYVATEIQFLQSIANMLGTAAADRRMEAALRESEGRFRSLVEHSMVGIFIVQEGKVVFMNPGQERIFGKIPVPFDLEELALRVHPEDLKGLLRLRRTNDFSW
jgi:PAS domain-containing protein